MLAHTHPTLEERFLAYFDRIVLCRYRSRPDLFRVREDDMGGEIEVQSTAEGDTVLGSAYYRVRFGFRELSDGRVCVAALVQDVEKVPEAELWAWRADRIAAPRFAASDPAFDRWSQRYLHGSWSSEDGPITKLEHELRLIQSMTRLELGNPLFRETHNPALRYPVAENSEAFTFALLEMFRLVVDGLSLDALKALSSKLGIALPVLERGERRGTLSTLKAMLPTRLAEAVYGPLKACSKERNKVHRISTQPACAFAAFKEFHRHAEAIHSALEELRRWLEQALVLNGKTCLMREEKMKRFPNFDRGLCPASKHDLLNKAIGKTIHRIDAGEVTQSEECHRREAIVIHFTDGSALALDVGSNASSLEPEFKGLRASKFSADLIPIWVPNPRE